MLKVETSLTPLPKTEPGTSGYSIFAKILPSLQRCLPSTMYPSGAQKWVRRCTEHGFWFWLRWRRWAKPAGMGTPVMSLCFSASVPSPYLTPPPCPPKPPEIPALVSQQPCRLWNHQEGWGGPAREVTVRGHRSSQACLCFPAPPAVERKDAALHKALL